MTDFEWKPGEKIVNTERELLIELLRNFYPNEGGLSFSWKEYYILHNKELTKFFNDNIESY